MLIDSWFSSGDPFARPGVCNWRSLSPMPARKAALRHLSIVTYLKDAKIDGAVIVTTPQEVTRQWQ